MPQLAAEPGRNQGHAPRSVDCGEHPRKPPIPATRSWRIHGGAHASSRTRARAAPERPQHRPAAHLRAHGAPFGQPLARARRARGRKSHAHDRAPEGARGSRRMRSPGTAYDDPRIGNDPQPAHMDGYVDTEDDNGGVHINSGIPNHAFYLAAAGFGGKAWLKAGKVWYSALTKALHRDADFMVAASATVDAAGTAFGTKGASVVRTAWKRVGIDVKGASPRQEKSPKLTTAKAKGAVTRAHSRGPERRTRRAS